VRDNALMSDRQRGVRDVKSAARTVEVLEVLGGLGGRAVSLRELTELTGAPRSSTYALLQTLVGRGWVRTDESGSRYSIGVRALLVGTSYLDADPLLAAAKPHLSRLAEELGETVHYARLDRADVVYLATYESRHYLRPFSRVGRRLPAGATSLGKAILAERSPAEVDRLLPAKLPVRTPATLDREGLLADLDATRRRGYALERGESTVGLRCAGVALHTCSPVTDAISCSVPDARMTAESERAIVDALLRTRRAIESSAPAQI
jgi:DNA-binding IclR family transcriptional regulator